MDHSGNLVLLELTIALLHIRSAGGWALLIHCLLPTTYYPLPTTLYLLPTR